MTKKPRRLSANTRALSILTIILISLIALAVVVAAALTQQAHFSPYHGRL